MRRNGNIELLRIILMYFIILHHSVIGGCGLRDSLTVGYSDNSICYKLLFNSFTIIAVNMFFLISGYFGIKWSFTKWLRIVVELYCYNTLFVLLAHIAGFQEWSRKTIEDILFPFNQYWYVFIYLLLLIMVPTINAALDILRRKEFTVQLVFWSILLCGYCFIYTNTPVGVLNGYSLVFAVYLYSVGYAMKKHRVLMLKPHSNLIIGILCCFCTFLLTLVACKNGSYDIAWRLFSYNQPLILFASINTLWYFIGKPNLEYDMPSISKYILPVYYIHVNTFVSAIRNMPLNAVCENYSWYVQAGFVLAWALVILITCLAISFAIYKMTNKIISCSVTTISHRLNWLLKMEIK